MKNNTLKKIIEEYREKRAYAQKKSMQQIDFLKKQHIELAQLEEDIYNLNLQIAKSTLTQQHTRLKALYESLDKIKRQKQALLQQLQIHPVDLLPHYECPLCEDTGYIEENQRWVKCSCLKNRLIQELYKDSGILNQIQRENFTTFCADLYSDTIDSKYGCSPRQNILSLRQESLSFIANFDNPNRKNLLFYGAPGLGKTFLCNCIAKQLMNEQKTVFYQSASDLFSLLSEFTFSKEETEKDQLQTTHDFIINSDLLIIDDLGSELTNSFTIAALFNIINHRMMQHQKMILSTNLSPNELHHCYGERIASRLVMSFNYYRFFGNDLRWEL